MWVFRNLTVLSLYPNLLRCVFPLTVPTKAFSFAAISECAIAASNIGFKAMQLVDFKLLKTTHLCNEDGMKHE